jgi:hypothetical protein
VLPNTKDAVVAKVYKSDRKLFDKTAQEWTKAYAVDPKRAKQLEEEKQQAELDEKVSVLREEGAQNDQQQHRQGDDHPPRQLID